MRIPREISGVYRRAVYRKDQSAIGNCGDDGGSCRLFRDTVAYRCPPEMPILFNFAVRYRSYFTPIFEFLNTKREISFVQCCCIKAPEATSSRKASLRGGGRRGYPEVLKRRRSLTDTSPEPRSRPARQKSYATASLVTAIISGVLCARFTKKVFL